uniref:Phosphatidylinositol-specific phospholipase C X domain-containing protein n=1 Tax=viral metagenome TaxID=1070528 RepID=A0A6C0HUR4_9ZZZZ
MKPLRKIIIICIVLISVFVLWILLLQRAKLQQLPSNVQEAVQYQEGFTTMGTSQINELRKVTSTTISPGVQSCVAIDTGNMLLREYCIKASYNSACTGTYVTIDMIKYVLARGCRFLDFEVYYLNTLAKGNSFVNSELFQPCVAFSNDSTGLTMKSKNYLPLSEVFQAIHSYGFQAPSPNPKDPLLVQLRIFSEDPKIYQDIAELVPQYLSQNLHKGMINANINTLNDIMGQIVLIVDTNNKKIPNPSTEKNKDLKSYINMYSGGTSVMKFSPDQMSEMLVSIPKIVDGQTTSSVKGYFMVEPGSIDSTIPPSSMIPLLDWLMPVNPVEKINISFFIRNYGVQIVEFPFYVRGDSLVAYEAFFEGLNSAIVPMYLALPYIAKTKHGML